MLPNWRYYKEITIDHTKVDSDLTDFPILVKLNSSNFVFSKSQSNGNDIRFVLLDGTLLKYEREQHDSTSQKAVYWVKIPFISSIVDTKFRLYFSNPAAINGSNPTNVWNNNFKGVWHLNQDPSGVAPQELDSTNNNNNGTSYGSMTSNDLVEGQIGKALNFDGVDDHVNCGTGSELDLTDDFTISFWVQATEDDNTNNRVISKGAYHSTGYEVFVSSTKIELRTYDGVLHSLNINCANTSQLNHFVVIKNGSTGSIYKNSIFIGSNTGHNINSNSGQFNIGRYQGGLSYYFTGLIDEVCILNVAHSAAWVKASYNSGNDSLTTFSATRTNTNALFFNSNF